jgi:two-component system chemotaxis response regulator CheY
MVDGLRVLAVDDSLAMRAILGTIVEAAGHDVVCAESVDIGLDLYKLHRPDVILTDYTMPGKTGRDLVLSLRADGFENPIFVISSERDPGIRMAMANAGADLWLPKPVCAATLLDALETVAQMGAVPFRILRSSTPTRTARSG